MSSAHHVATAGERLFVARHYEGMAVDVRYNGSLYRVHVFIGRWGWGASDKRDCRLSTCGRRYHGLARTAAETGHRHYKTTAAAKGASARLQYTASFEDGAQKARRYFNALENKTGQVRTPWTSLCRPDWQRLEQVVLRCQGQGVGAVDADTTSRGATEHGSTCCGAVGATCLQHPFLRVIDAEAAAQFVRPYVRRLETISKTSAKMYEK